MNYKQYSFRELLSNIVDNRGKTCPTAKTGIPLIATNCIKNDALYPVLEKVRYVSKQTYENWFRGHPEPDDIIFVCKGSPGNVSWVADPVPFCIAQDMVAIRADETKIYSRFLFALLRSRLSQKKILNMHVGTLIPHFKKGDFSNLYFDIPTDFNYQRFVGDTYYFLCKKIEQNRRMNETLEGMAQALFKSWFVDFDPVLDNALASGKEIPSELREKAEARQKLRDLEAHLHPLPKEIRTLFPDEFTFTDELGWIPKGWDISQIKKIGKVITGKTPPKKIERAFSDSGVPFITPSDINDTIFVTSTNRFLTVTGKGSVKNNFIKAGSVCVTCIGSQMGKTVIASLNSFTNQQINSVVLEDNNCKNYLFFNLRNRREEIFNIGSSGSTMPIINKSTFSNLTLLLPAPKVQRYFNELTTPSMEAILSNDQKSLTLSKLRDTLLPKLLSGEIRIPDAKKLVEAVR